MRGLNIIIILLICLSCSPESRSDSGKTNGGTNIIETEFSIDSLELIDSKNILVTVNKKQKKTWENKTQFIDELSTQKHLHNGDDFHEYLHYNYDYIELLELTKHELKLVRSYALCAMRKYSADTLFSVATSVRKDTAQVISIWDGKSDRHVNCYTIAQIAAQSLIWYEHDGEITDKQKLQMEEQMKSDLAPISDECGIMYSF